MTNPVIVTPRDVINSGGCVSGIREWFHRHNLDHLLRTFMKEGLSADVLLETNDESARRAVQCAEDRVNGG